MSDVELVYANYNISDLIDEQEIADVYADLTNAELPILISIRDLKGYKAPSTTSDSQQGQGRPGVELKQSHEEDHCYAQSPLSPKEKLKADADFEGLRSLSIETMTKPDRVDIDEPMEMETKASPLPVLKNSLGKKKVGAKKEMSDGPCSKSEGRVQVEQKAVSPKLVPTAAVLEHQDLLSAITAATGAMTVSVNAKASSILSSSSNSTPTTVMMAEEPISTSNHLAHEICEMAKLTLTAPTSIEGQSESMPSSTCVPTTSSHPDNVDTLLDSFFDLTQSIWDEDGTLDMDLELNPDAEPFEMESTPVPSQPGYRSQGTTSVWNRRVREELSNIYKKIICNCNQIGLMIHVIWETDFRRRNP
jgi:hypothetical protein